MYIDLAGDWSISLEADEGPQSGRITLPGILQGAGYGNPVTRQTPWVSALHDSFWYEREEYKFAQEEGVNVPFLAQPPRHFLGQAVYERDFTVPGHLHEGAASGGAREWIFHAELARWRSRVWVDGEYKGEDCTLCAPHDIRVGALSPGLHRLRVELDNSMLYPYRPDAHGVSDALGATWNGMAGEIALFTEDVAKSRALDRQIYAVARPKSVEVSDGRFLIDGKPFYFRATHFGGEYPLTGYPSTDREWWRKVMGVVREWGLNAIRFHSNCPPEAAFAAADEEGVYLLVECGMWNHFEEGPEGDEMCGVLRRETRKILENFGHHPSFAFFSPTNEPGGAWYRPLDRWVEETREYDRRLGFGGRRVYTAQSGWFYDVPPAEVEVSDFIYFHRSAYGPLRGGTIRNPVGWQGKDYSPSLTGAKKPVVCHELGQICAYPDPGVIDKFTGYLRPGNYRVFRENAGAAGLLPHVADFAVCSGENQVRLYKEELEANFRTPEIQGFELLDLHDYLGQGTALVGILDAFWESKGYCRPEDFRHFCGDTVLLARCRSYVWKNTDTAVIPVEVCHYGKDDIREGVVRWTLCRGAEVLRQGCVAAGDIRRGGNTKAGDIVLSFDDISENVELTLTLSLCPQGSGDGAAREEGADGKAAFAWNSWTLYVFAESAVCGGGVRVSPEAPEQGGMSGASQESGGSGVLYTRDWQEAKAALAAGGKVVFSPYLSDLGYDCAALSGRSVGWNSQMGPTWCRTMGVVVDAAHPIFRHFPTGRSGGWQWEDILRHGRGFHMEGLAQVEPVVRPIDDWNRNLSQGLLFEARMLGGALFFVSADLEGSFAQRPAAYSLKRAILAYAASEEFAPAAAVEPEAVEGKFFPMLRMRGLTKRISYAGEGCPGDVVVRNGGAVVEADPNTSVRVEKGDFPVCVTLELERPVSMRGILYVPEQRDRDHAGFVEAYTVEVRDGGTNRWERVAEGTFLNTDRAQKGLFGREVTGDAVRLTVLSAYGCVDKYVWEEGERGWTKVYRPRTAVVQIAGIHILCDEDAPHGDDILQAGQKTKTQEIDL